jgi:hypothetical protein
MPGGGASRQACVDDGTKVYWEECGVLGEDEGKILVAWGFEGAASCAEAKVAFVQIRVESAETGAVEFDGTFDCADGSALLTGFQPGTFTVVLKGLDSGGYTRYETSLLAEVASGTTNLGQVALDFILGNITFSWSFNGVEDCGTVGVSDVQIVVLDAQEQAVFNEIAPCDDGGVKIADFVRGLYTLALYGLDVAGERLYQATVPLWINMGDNEFGTVDLKSITTYGTVSFTWTFDGGLDCGAAGVASVEILLASPGGQTVFSDTPACAAPGYTISNLEPGYYDLRLVGKDSEGVSLYAAGTVRVEVKAGNNNLGNIDLSRP